MDQSARAATGLATCPSKGSVAEKLPEPLPVVAPVSAGAVPGTFAVQGGAATYTIPLWVPPGRAGVQPALSISYDSSAGEGVLGMGASLSGLSTIGRCAKDRAQDGVLRGVRYDTEDPFCLDGLRLVEVGGTASAVEYRTLPDTFQKVVAFYEPGWDPAKGPTHFRVQLPNGRVREYGKRIDGRVVVRSGIGEWWLTRELDPHGNYYEVTYENLGVDTIGHSVEFYPDRIAYTMNDAHDLAATRWVVFEYIPWTDHASKYVDGRKVWTPRRLARVRLEYIEAGDVSVARLYRFDYDRSTTGRALLERVWECGSEDPSTCKPPTKLEWIPGMGGSFPDPAEAVASVAPLEQDGVVLADVTGDGLDDIVVGTWDEISVMVNRGDQTYAPRTSWGAHFGVGLKPVDYDQDGRMDLLVPGGATWRVLRSRADASFDVIDTGLDVPELLGRSEIVDYNGDGRGDLAKCHTTFVAVPGRGTATMHWWAIIDLHSRAALFSAPLQFPCDASVHFVDLDADGAVDILFPPEPECGDPAYPCTFAIYDHAHDYRRDSGLPVEIDVLLQSTTFADVNGDGHVDAIRWNDVRLETHMNNGVGFEPPIASLAAHPAGWTFERLRETRPIDYNADGSTDLLVVGNASGDASSAWWILQASTTGDGTFTAIPLGIPWEEGDDLWVTDASGDGRHDLLSRQTDVIELLVSEGPQDLLRTITDGRNHLDRGDLGFVPNVEITYGTLISRDGDGALYQARWWRDEDCVYPRSCIAGPIRVVASYAMNDGVGGQRRQDLRYFGARYDWMRRDWLGFGAISEVDSDTGAGNIRFYDNRERDDARAIYWFAGLVEEEWAWVPVDPAASSSKIILTYTHVSNTARATADGASYFTMPQSTRVYTYEGTYAPGATPILEYVRAEQANVADRLSEVRRSLDVIDGYGNIVEETHEVVGLDVTTTSRQFVNHDGGGEWLLGLVDREEVCSTVDGARVCRVADATHNGYGDVIALWTGDPADPRTQATTRHIHDGLGNLVISSVEEVTGDLRSSCRTWDHDGIFPIATTNQLGHTSYTLHHPGLGVPLASVDANGLVTRWQVDRLGRVVREERPDGTATTSAMTRSRTGGPAGSWWTVKTTTTESTGAEVTVETDMLERVVKMVWPGPDVPAMQGAVSMAVPEYAQTTEYDAQGRVTRVSMPHLTATPAAEIPYTTLRHDGAGRPVEVTASWGLRTQATYDGFFRTTYDVGSPATGIVESDALGRPVNVWDRRGTLTRFSYGPFGPVTAVENAGETTTYGRDAIGRIVSETSPHRGTTTNTWNGFGEIVDITDALGRLTSFAYDDLGRTIARTDGDGTTTFTYDPPTCLGCLAEVTSPDAITKTYEYDVLARPIGVRLTLDGETFGVTARYGAGGRVEDVVYPGGTGVSDLVLRYDYDSRGNPIRVGNAATGKPYWKLREVDGAGRTHLVELGNRLETRRTYGPMSGALEEITTWRGTTLLDQLRYNYDDRLNVSRRTNAILGTDEFPSYDELDRLTCVSPTAKRDTCLLSLDYADNGNIAFKSDVGTYVYDPAKPHAVRTIGAEIYGYDAVGNQIDRPNLSIEYTPFDLPRRFTSKLDGHEVELQYDGLHSRVRRREAMRDLVSLEDLYEREIDRDTGKIILHRYRIPLGEDRLEIVRKPSVPDELVYASVDALGSPTLLTDATGAVLERRAYDPFGRAATPPSPSLTRLGFTGQEDELDDGLVNMKGRTYDPRLGRMLQVDPVNSDPLNSQRWNAYGYVLNNPLRFTDPSGFTESTTFTIDAIVPPPPPIADGGAPAQVITGEIEVTLYRARAAAVPSSEGAADESIYDEFIGQGDASAAPQPETPRAAGGGALPKTPSYQAPSFESMPAPETMRSSFEAWWDSWDASTVVLKYGERAERALAGMAVVSGIAAAGLAALPVGATIAGLKVGGVMTGGSTALSAGTLLRGAGLGVPAARSLPDRLPTWAGVWKQRPGPNGVTVWGNTGEIALDDTAELVNLIGKHSKGTIHVITGAHATRQGSLWPQKITENFYLEDIKYIGLGRANVIIHDISSVAENPWFLGINREQHFIRSQLQPQLAPGDHVIASFCYGFQNWMMARLRP